VIAVAVTVGDMAGAPYGLEEPPQRLTFHANGRYWDFFGDGNNIKFVSSVDCIVWTGETAVPAAFIFTSRGYQFSVWADDTYVYIAYIDNTTAGWGPLRYRRGLLNADGTITWDSEETVDSDANCMRPAICKASDGSIHISFQLRTDMNLYWRKKNGFWSPRTLIRNEDNYVATSLVPLSTGGKVYLVYCKYLENRLWGYLYDAGWGPRETVSADTLTSYAYFSVTVDVNDYVHVGYIVGAVGSITLKHVKRIAVWQAPVNVHDGGLAFCVLHLCADPAGSDVWGFWWLAGTFYYKRYDGVTWDVAPTAWFAEANVRVIFNCFWWVTNAAIGVTWVRGVAAPYDVRYACLTLAVPPKPGSSAVITSMKAMELIDAAQPRNIIGLNVTVR